MIVAGGASYFRRIAVKLVEMAAAGIGTAVTGYLVAYITGHFSLFMPTAVTPAPQQAVSWHAVTPEHTASIEATVRAALASHDGSDAAAPAATTTPPAPAPAVVEASSTPTVAPPLATTEIKTLPVATAVDPLPARSVDAALQSDSDGWPAEPARVATTGSLRMLPPQPPPANFNPLTALKHFF
jgi:hypothetical protein